MHRTSGRILLIAAAFALFLVPVAAIAAGGFTDVGDDNVFKADIQWMKDAGVTKGCNPPTNDKFCPEANVTREQMSAFMHRLAVNRVVDAGTVEGYTAEQLMAGGGTVGPEGPAGPAGADGAVGPAGADGAVGPAGPIGPTGADSTVPGPKGDQGDPGDKGDKGDKGDTGPIGPTGADSTVPGPKGDQGDPGDKGDTGPIGPTGADSTVPGPKGDQGDPGADGVSGLERVVHYEGFTNVKVGAILVVNAGCPTGKMVTGGGGITSSTDIVLVTSSTNSSMDQWTTKWQVLKQKASVMIFTEAICVNAPTP